MRTAYAISEADFHKREGQFYVQFFRVINYNIVYQSSGIALRALRNKLPNVSKRMSVS